MPRLTKKSLVGGTTPGIRPKKLPIRMKRNSVPKSDTYLRPDFPMMLSDKLSAISTSISMTLRYVTPGAGMTGFVEPESDWRNASARPITTGAPITAVKFRSALRLKGYGNNEYEVNRCAMLFRSGQRPDALGANGGEQRRKPQ